MHLTNWPFFRRRRFDQTTLLENTAYFKSLIILLTISTEHMYAYASRRALIFVMRLLYRNRMRCGLDEYACLNRGVDTTMNRYKRMERPD